MIKSTWRAALLLGAVFLGGVLAGSGGLVLAHRAGFVAAPGGRRSTEAYLHRLTGDLKLDARQQDSVRAILERYRPAMDSLRQDVDTKFTALRLSIRGEITGVLTPEQRQRYDQLTQRMDAERKRMGR